MDVERIKKINEMTKTLKEHGMIEDPSKNELAENELKENDNVAQKDQNNNFNDASNKSYITKDKLEIALERNTRKIMEVINNLINEINVLRKRIDSLESRPTQIIEKQIIPSNSHEPAIKKQSPPVVQEQNIQKPKKTHTRSDPNMKEDVSIEKIFYYGKK